MEKTRHSTDPQSPNVAIWSHHNGFQQFETMICGCLSCTYSTTYSSWCRFKFISESFFTVFGCSLLGCSVTKIGKISPLWQNLRSLRLFWMVYLVFGQLLYLLWHLYATELIVSVVNGQILNANNLAVFWSHCLVGAVAVVLLSLEQRKYERETERGKIQ